uniref:60S ribosomal protein L29 n=1 Tax=Mycena chlorophos TaxID=658473 RepID=A0ABQ0LSD3_MYCCL|nr:predicted protein [Mycena chlorophos]
MTAHGQSAAPITIVGFHGAETSADGWPSLIVTSPTGRDRVTFKSLPPPQENLHPPESKSSSHVQIQEVCRRPHTLEKIADYTSPATRTTTKLWQNKKAHRNGIKRPAAGRTRSFKGVDPKFRRNAKHALAGSNAARKAAKMAA